MEIKDEELKSFKNDILQAIDDKNRLTVDLLLQEMRASEKRYDKKLDLLKDEILTGVGEMFDGQVVPQLDDHEERIVKLEMKVA